MNTSFNTDKFKNIPTPFYYYDMDLLRETLHALNEAAAQHPSFVVHYAMKANANPALLKVISGAGLGADCVSGWEVSAACAGGFAPANIVFAGVGKTDGEIATALKAGIGCFNVESLEELAVINDIAARAGTTARIAFRVNPNVDAHTLAKITTGLAENKFGISTDSVEHAIRTAEVMHNVKFAGLHFHIGSQITSTKPFAALCHVINKLQDTLEKDGISVPTINVGGGLGVDYGQPDNNPIPDFKGYFAAYAETLETRPGQTVHFELGRSVVAQCGSLITRALYVKHGKAKTFAIVDAGMNDLIRPALYQAVHKIENISSTAEENTYDVVGPICESSDVFAKDITLPATKRGDLLAIRSAGAYGEVMASQYNCRPLAKSYTSDAL